MHKREVVNIVRRTLDELKWAKGAYRLSLVEYFLDILFNGDMCLELHNIVQMVNKLANELGIPFPALLRRTYVWINEEPLYLGIGFNLPYIKRLTESNICYGFIYVEREFLDYFPPMDEKFKLITPEREYTACVNSVGRIYLTKWFKDNPQVKVGDKVIIWADSLTPRESERYYLCYQSKSKTKD